MNPWLALVGLALVMLAGLLMLALTLLPRKTPRTFREIPAFLRLRRAIGRVVEDGSRLHVSLGRGSLISPQSAPAFVGLAVLRRLAELTSAGDQPPVATSGEASLASLSRDTLLGSSRPSAQGSVDPTSGRLTGLSPFSFAAGALPAMRDENVSANVLIGSFGVEAGLLTDAGERQGTFTVAGSDSLAAQAVIFASAEEPLIGEEVFAAGAYVEAGRMHPASLAVQDILRWLIILSLLAGSLLTLAGLL